MKLPSLVWDMLAFTGLAVLSAGAALAYPPAGLIVPGVVLLALGLLGSRSCS